MLERMATMVILKTSCVEKKLVFLPLAVTLCLCVKGGEPLLQAAAAQVLVRAPRNNAHLCLVHAMSQTLGGFEL